MPLGGSLEAPAGLSMPPGGHLEALAVDPARRTPRSSGQAVDASRRERERESAREGFLLLVSDSYKTRNVTPSWYSVI